MSERGWRINWRPGWATTLYWPEPPDYREGAIHHLRVSPASGWEVVERGAAGEGVTSRGIAFAEALRLAPEVADDVRVAQAAIEVFTAKQSTKWLARRQRYRREREAAGGGST